MLGFTKQEQGIILFLLLTFFVGLAVSFFKRSREPVLLPVSADESIAFRKQVAKIDSLKMLGPGKTPGDVRGSANRGTRAPQTRPVQKPLAININTAGAEELQKLPKIGPVLAQKIVDYRLRNGDFKTIEELAAVKGIGNATLKKIKPYVTLK